jgi:tRNA(fMet)-specific endonuclease VapC
MTSYLLDTNHSSALYRGDSALTSTIVSGADTADRFYLCLPSIGELWLMVYKSARVTENAALLRTFLDDYEHLSLDPAAAEIFGRTKAHLRRIGRPIPNIDLQIACIALANDLTVLTADAHLHGVPNLRHEQPAVRQRL